MASVSSRRARVWAIVYWVIGFSTWAVSARAVVPEVFEEGADGPGIVAYPPREAAPVRGTSPSGDREVPLRGSRSASRRGAPKPQPVTVMLHGMCSEPERACRHFAETVSERGWLLCPRATRRCPGGGSTWPFTGFEPDIEAGIERVRERHPGRLDESDGRTLVGFSLGAFRALSLAQGAKGTYPRVILIGAKIYPDARLLAKAGVERLLLAAGDYDMMNGHMRGRARSLARQGFPVAFQSYGPVGHAFPRDFSEFLTRGLDWVEGGDVALPP